MAIRLVHQPIGIGGLAAYAAGRGRAQERQRKYAAAARPRGRAGVLPEGRFVDPLAPLDPALAALASPLGEALVDPAAAEADLAMRQLASGGRRAIVSPEREAELEQRRNLVTQRAQFRAAARAGRTGRKYYGNLLPYFVPQAEIDRRQELADEERQRAFTLERDEAARTFSLERDAAGYARDDMMARRRAVEREASSLRSEIPSWVQGRDRTKLLEKIAGIEDFARPDVDLTDPAYSSAYSDAVADVYSIIGGLKRPDPTETERASTYYRDGTTGEVLDGYREGAVPFDSRTGRPIDLPPAQPDPAAEQAAELRAEYNKAYSTRLKSLLGTKNDDDDTVYTFDTADKAAKEYAADVVQGLEGIRNRQAPVSAPGAFLGRPEDAPEQLNRNAPVNPPGAFLGAPEPAAVPSAPTAQQPANTTPKERTEAIEAVAFVEKQIRELMAKYKSYDEMSVDDKHYLRMYMDARDSLKQQYAP